MDKNINTRSCMNVLNLKTLEMNCLKMKQANKKVGGKKGGVLQGKENI